MNIAKPDVKNMYLCHKDINNYLKYLAKRYKKFVKLINIAKTFEGRYVKGILIDHSIGNLGINRNMIFIEGGTHAREWITISVALYCINQLTEKHFRHMDILSKARFFIVPLVNPDGYEYSRTQNKRWRKNRSLNSKNKCIGTDCNRNYDFKWKFKEQADGVKCTFKGEFPFSEVETQGIKNMMETFSDQILFFLSLHSYAQSIMYPWAYTKELPPQWPLLHEVAEAGFGAIKKSTGRIYKYGSISNVTKKIFSGTVVDYAFGVMKIPICLVMELPSSKYGFQPPNELIESIAIESWIGIRAMCMESLSSYNKILYIPQTLIPKFFEKENNDENNDIKLRSAV
ncbi:hypothetical protein ACFFRR_009781 [Megaselia abdita]